MNAVIYARYSSHQQTEQSIEGQLRDCYQFANQKNIKIIGEYIDRAQSGRTDNRADFQRMIKDSSKKLFDAVIVWKIDRFGRNREEIAINKVKFRKNGVSILYAKEHVPEGPEGIILESVLEGMAEYYSANLSQNVMRGMRESALKCQSTGSAIPLGFKIGKDKKFEIDEGKASIVRELFNLYDSGYSFADIARELNDKGYRTAKGKLFRCAVMRGILSNRKYIGEYSWKDVVIPNGIPKIIDDELFERVQIKLKTKSKKMAKRNDWSEFYLTGKLFCGHCETMMVGDSGTSQNGTSYYYYICPQSKRHKCNKKSIRKEKLEKLVAEITCKEILVPELMETIADQIIAVQEANRKDTSLEDYYTHRLNEVSASISNIMKAIEQGIITDTTKSRLIELEGQKAELEENLALEKEENPAVTKEEILYYLDHMNRKAATDPDSFKYLVRTFIKAIFLFDDKIILTYNLKNKNSTVTLDECNNAIFCSDNSELAQLSVYNPNKIFFGVHFFGIVVSLKDYLFS